MIIKGNIRTDGKALGDYLLSEGRYEKNFDKNEKIEIWEANGVEHGDDLKEILADFQHSAAGTQCKKPLFHVAIRLYDDETLTREQWLEAVNRLEERLELAGRERVIVTHNLNGHEHVHVVWNRIDHEQRKAAGLHYYKHKCTDVARELEKEFGLRELSNDRKRGSLSRDEEQQAIRHGKSPQEIKEELRACWKQADNGKSFAAALDEQGYLLAKGDRRDFVIVGQEGEVYGVARETGNKAAQVRAKLADLDRESLPNVQEAKELQLDRAATRDALKWEDELAKAAIEKAKLEERAEKQREAHERKISISANLSKTAGEIRLAYGLTHSGPGFAAALEERGLILAHVNAEDVRSSELSQKAAKAIGKDAAPPILNEGEIVVVNGYGSVYRLNQRTTGHSKAEVEHYLKTVDRSELLSVADAKDVMREAQDKRLGDWEVRKKQGAGRRGATLYNRSDMVSTQRDAMRHLKDAKRRRQRNGDDLNPMHPDEHRQRQEEERAYREKPQQQETESKDVRRDFWEEMRALKRSTQGGQAREDKKDRTEQTEYQKAKAQRDALREQTDALLGRQSRGDRGDEVDGHERERE